MYTREEIINNYKNVDFPKSLFEESSLNNKNILFYDKSKPPLSTKTKDNQSLSQSYILPWRILQQKNNYNNYNKNEFSRGANFTPTIPKEPVIEIKIENFKLLYNKFSIPLEKKLIYLRNKLFIFGPFNYEELQTLYNSKKFDSSYEFKTVDIFSFPEEDPNKFYPLKNVNEDKWVDAICDSPLLEYTELFIKVKELLDGTKKRKAEINELNEEIKELTAKNDDKDIKINELTYEIESLKKELLNQKEIKEQEKSNNKDNEQKIEIIEVEKKVIYNDNDNNEEKEIIEEKDIEIISPKILDTGGEWEIAGKKKKKVEKIQEETKTIVGISSKKGAVKNNTDSLIKAPGSNKNKKSNTISGDELVDMLKPKKKEVPKEEGVPAPNEFVEVKAKGKGKKKNKKQFESTDINLGFKFK